MKKTFSLLLAVFMMVGLVTLVGCNGLWNFDDDDTYVPSIPNIVTLSSSVVLPAGAVGSIRADKIDSSLGTLTATLYARSDAGTALASSAVDSSTGDYIIKTSIAAGDYFIQVTNSSNTIKLLNYVTVASPSDTPKMENTGSATTAIGYLIQDADNKSKNVKISDYSVNDTDIITFAGNIENLLKDADKTKTPTIPTVVVSSIALNKTTTTISLGGNETLVPTLLPAYADDLSVTWTISTNTNIATINPTTGLITAGTATGTVTVTATSVGNSTVKASCEVTVTKEIVLVSAINLNKSTLSLSSGAVETLTVDSVLPANASDKTYEWASDNTAVATVDATTGLVTAGTTAGTANITATAKDGSGVKGTCVVTVTVPVASKVVTFDKTVSNMGVADFQIHITGTGIDSNYDTATTVEANGTKDIAKSDALSSSTKLVLAFNGLAFDTITDFSTLTFTVAIPVGAKVEIKQNDGTLVATSK